MTFKACGKELDVNANAQVKMHCVLEIIKLFLMESVTLKNSLIKYMLKTIFTKKFLFEAEDLVKFGN